jgi:3-hydroxyacyl-CoA dehydrogenase
MSNFIVRKVAALGAGVMGAQIAAQCVNAKVPALLFDLPAKDKDGGGPPSASPVAKNGIVLKAIENLKKLNPAPLGNKDDARFIEAANYEEHLDLLRGCDVIIEAIAAACCCTRRYSVVCSGRTLGRQPRGGRSRRARPFCRCS